MSIEAIVWVFKNSNSTLSDRLILIAIANDANAEGENAYPSIRRIAETARLSETQVHRSIKALVACGELGIELRGGRHRSNLYSLPQMAEQEKGANLAPFLEQKGANFEEKGCHLVRERVPILQEKGATVAPDPLLPFNTDPLRDNHTPTYSPPWLPQEAWEAFLEMRKKKRNPLTEHAKRLAFRALEQLRVLGHDPETVLNQSTMRGWQGLFAVHDNGTENHDAVSKPSYAEVRSAKNKAVLRKVLGSPEPGATSH